MKRTKIKNDEGKIISAYEKIQSASKNIRVTVTVEIDPMNLDGISSSESGSGKSRSNASQRYLPSKMQIILITASTLMINFIQNLDESSDVSAAGES